MAITITRDELDQYAADTEAAKKLASQARAIKKRCSKFEDKVREQLEANDKTSAKRLGYGLALVDGKPYVNWKDVFIAEAGEEKADEIWANAEPNGKKVVISPPSD